jgi:hypothetical protein
MERGLPYTLTDDEFASIVEKNCFYCGVTPSYREKVSLQGNLSVNGIDRLDSTKGYIRENCVPCCKTCNFAKRRMSYAEFSSYLDRVSAYRSPKSVRKSGVQKFSFDIHGTIDRKPEVFAALTQALVKAGCEVHILTGSRRTPKLEKYLVDLGIHYTHFGSITDFRTSQGVGVTCLPNGDPWMDKEIWDRAKSEYCLQHNIAFHLDNSPDYGKHFKTPYFQLVQDVENTLHGVKFREKKS